MNKRILICGDSFAADWTVKYPNQQGWPNMLAQKYNVTNLAQAGCSEYKIYKQIISKSLNDYDIVIVSHTSPYRIYVLEHPVHSDDPLHRNSDLIYTDIEEHVKNNKSLQPIVDFYENYFDTDYAQFVHNLICEKIDSLFKTFNSKVLHVTNLNWKDLYQFGYMLNFETLFKTNRGLMNHYNLEGNTKIFESVDKLINS